MAESGLSFALARSGHLLAWHTPHTVRVPAAACGFDPFHCCGRASLWPGAAPLRSLQPACRGTGGPLAAQTRDDHLYALPHAMCSEHPPDTAAGPRTTAGASALRHFLLPGNNLALL